jgi:hypothetical protein
LLVEIVVVSAPFVGEATEFSFDERVDIAIHHVLDAAGLNAGSEVFHELIGLEDVVPDLGTEGDVGFFPVLAFEFGVFAVEFHLLELCGEHSHREGTVLCLRAFALAGGDEAGCFVTNPYSGLDFVDVLSAFSSGAVSIDFNIGFVDFDGGGLWQFGDDIDRCERGVSAFILIEWGD